MGTTRRFVILVAALAIVVTTAAGFAVAQGRKTTRPARPGSDGVIHVVKGPGGILQFFDFDNDGLTLGDRLAAVGPLLNASQTQRVGTDYLDCWVGDKALLDQSPYVCTDVLRFKDGNITTNGLDPHGVSDVFFSITGGTGAYEGATGQAEYVDSETQTDVYIHLDE